MRTLRDLAYGRHGERNLLDLYLPDTPPACPTAPLPTVLCIHGGGWHAGDKLVFEWMAAPLVAQGFAAASITYRFWPQWTCPAAIDDAQRAVRFLRRHADQYGLDPRRFGAIGGSAGAHLAAHLALAETRDDSDPGLAGISSRVQCVVDCYGPVDFPAMMESASAPIVEGFMGQPFNAATRPAYEAASPYYRVGKFLPPFLIVHGTADVGTQQGQVPLTISRRFAQRLRQAGAQATLIELPDAPHGFTPQPQSPHTQAMWAAAVPFLRRCLA